jgi:hypothetical protein
MVVFSDSDFLKRTVDYLPLFVSIVLITNDKQYFTLHESLS